MASPRLQIVITAQDQATRVLKGITAPAQGLGSALGDVGKVAGGVVAGMAGFAVGARILDGVRGAALDLNKSLEQSQLAFATMLGSAEKAEGFLSDLSRFAAQTPFEFPELVDASKKMLAFGFSAEQVVPLLTSVGDAAAAMGSGAAGIDTITRALGQMQAKGKVSAEEMLQLTEAGIPAWDMLAQKLGTDVAGAMDAVSKRTVAAATMIDAFQEGSASRFGNMMAQQANTFDGAMSTIKDSVGMMIAQSFKPLFNAVSQVAQGLARFVQSEQFTAWARSIAGVLQGAIDWIMSGVGAFQSLLRMTQNIARDHGLSMFDSAITATTLLIRERFGEQAAGVFQRFIDLLGLWKKGWELEIGAVKALVEGYVALATRMWERHGAEILAAAEGAWQGIQAVIDTVLQAVVPFATEMLGTVVDWTERNWPLIQQTVETVMEAVGSVVRTVLAAVAAFWEEHGETIMRVVSAAWTVIKESISTALDVVLSLITATMQAINGDWEGAWETMGGLLGRVWENFKDIVRAGIGAVWELVQGLPGILLDIGDAVYRAGQAIARSLIDGLVGALSGLASALTNAIASAVRGIKVDIGPFHLDASGFRVDAPHIPTPSLPSPAPSAAPSGDDGGGGGGGGGFTGADFNAAAQSRNIVSGSADWYNLGRSMGVLMAEGGIATRPTRAIVGEAGPEAIIPLSRAGSLGGGIHVHVAGSVISQGDLLDFIVTGLRRRQLLIGSAY